VQNKGAIFNILEELDMERELMAKVVKLKPQYFGHDVPYKYTVTWSCCKGKCRTASTDCPRRKYGRNTLSRQTKKTMAQRHRRLDGVQVHSAKGDVIGQRAT